MAKRFSAKEEILRTRAILNSSYDIHSGGIPPHARMLEQIVEGREMDDYSHRTFSCLEGSSNLLAIPSLTIYVMEGDEEEAAAYFGQDMADKVYAQKRQLKELATQGENAILRHYFLRHYFNPGSSLNFEPLSTEEISAIIEEPDSKRYFIKRYNSFGELSAPPFSFATDFNAEVNWTREGIRALSEANKLWFSEPLYSRAIEIHAKKLDLMNQLLRYAIGKVNELGFADVKIFNPETYFGESRRVTISELEESFQKYFGRPIPSAVELLEWSESVLAEVQEKYTVNPK